MYMELENYMEIYMELELFKPRIDFNHLICNICTMLSSGGNDMFHTAQPPFPLASFINMQSLI